MRFPSRFLVAFCLVLATGCPESADPPPQAESPQSPAADIPAEPEQTSQDAKAESEPEPDPEPLPQDDPDALAALEELGVQLSHDRAGRVIAVDASEIEADLTDEHVAHFKGLPALAKVNLDYSQVSNEGLALLKEVPTIRVLSLRRCGNVDDEGLAYLTELPQLEQLLLLYNSSSITDAGMKHVGQIKTLRLLDLRGCTQIGNAGLAHLKGLTNLVDLRLQCPPVTDEGVAHLSALTKLRNLALEKTRVTSDGLAALEPLVELQGLNLYSTPVDDAGLVHLQGMTQLKDVKLRDTATVGTGLVHLHPSKETLWRLDLSETFVTDEGLANVAPLRNLESLNLWYAGVTDAGMSQLAGLGKLRELNLEECDVGNEGLQEIAGLTPLESLNLANTRVTDEGLQTLQSLTNLKSLDLSSTQISDEAVSAFQQAVPGCEVKQ